MRIALGDVAHARSGDKGDGSNVGLIASSRALYEVLLREVTAERVKEHFREVCRGEVERFEVPNLLALNFLLHDSLGGGGTLSLKTDAQGKTHGQGLLTMQVEVPAELVPTEHGTASAFGGASLGWETIAAPAPGSSPATSGGREQPPANPAAGSAAAMKGE